MTKLISNGAVTVEAANNICFLLNIVVALSSFWHAAVSRRMLLFCWCQNEEEDKKALNQRFEADLRRWSISPESVKLERTAVLGRGTFGTVYAGTYTMSSNKTSDDDGCKMHVSVIDVAVKTMRCPPEMSRHRFLASLASELRVHMTAWVDCPDLFVRAFGVFCASKSWWRGSSGIARLKQPQDKEEAWCIVLERMDCTLSQQFSLWRNRQLHKGPDIHKRAKICESLLNSVSYCHRALGIVHGDLKMNNYLVGRNGGGHLCYKLSDFGLSRNLQPGGLFKDNGRRQRLRGGDMQQTSARVWQPKKFWYSCRAGTAFADESVDVFAVAFIVCEVLFGKLDRGLVRQIKAKRMLVSLENRVPPDCAPVARLLQSILGFRGEGGEEGRRPFANDIRILQAEVQKLLNGPSSKES